MWVRMGATNRRCENVPEMSFGTMGQGEKMTQERMVEHHIKYKELHGVDETIWMTNGEHEKLHRLLRKEGMCNVPVEELTKISASAQRRTDKSKKRNKEYYKMNIRRVNFYSAPGPNVRLLERITYNLKTETIRYSANFFTRHDFKLPVIDIENNKVVNT